MLEVKNLPLPGTLADLVERGVWSGWIPPSVQEELVPGIDAQLELCSTLESMDRNSRFVEQLRGAAEFARHKMRTYKSSLRTESMDLPWLDEDRSFFVAVGNRGDDTGLALDYRVCEDGPRVVAGYWVHDPVGMKQARLEWREAAGSFDELLRMLTADGPLPFPEDPPPRRTG